MEFCGILFKLGSLNNSRPAMWNIDKKGNYHHVKFNSLSYIYVMCFVGEVSFYLFYFQNCLNKFAHEMGEMLKYFNVSLCLLPVCKVYTNQVTVGHTCLVLVCLEYSRVNDLSLLINFYCLSYKKSLFLSFLVMFVLILDICFLCRF